jgi:hypothetical protein
MKPVCETLKRGIAGAALIAAFAIAGPSLASAQESTTTTSTTTASSEEEVSTTTTAEKICEAIQRTDARRKKWIEQGIPEEFGSEEPFTFDPSKC